MNTNDKQLFKNTGRLEFADMLKEAGYYNQSEKYLNCGENSIFIKCRDCGHIHSYDISCGLRVCDKCGGSYSKLLPRYKSLMDSVEYPKLLTLTIKNIDELNESVLDSIREKFHTFRKRYNSLDQGDHRDYIEKSDIQEKKKNYHRSAIAKYSNIDIKGGLYVIEIKNTGDMWNIHIHSIVDSFFISQLVVSELWREVTPSDSFIVDVRNVSATKGMMYCLKYLNKTPEIKYVDDMVTFHHVTHSKRLIGTFGSLYNVNLDKINGTCDICGSENLEFLGSTSMSYSFYDYGRSGHYKDRVDPYQTVFV